MVEFLKSSFSLSTKGFDDLVERFTANSDNLTKGPYLTYDMPFREGDSDAESFPDIPLGFKPYKHQEIAFARLRGSKPESTIIATGTGSGKTECFTWPILDYCKDRKGERGIKAILIYPMNELATNQAMRLAETIWNNDQLKGNIRVGLYADKQPESPDSEMSESKVITSRDEIRNDSPDILITNYKMLDYMLVRPSDKPMWSQNTPDTLRNLVVDVLHTFDGAQGTDLACLIRRLKARLNCRSNYLCCIGTSATLGQYGLERISDYASQIFGEPIGKDTIVTEDRITLGEYLQVKDTYGTVIPESKQIADLQEEVDGLAPVTLIQRVYALWFGKLPDSDVEEEQWRVSLAEELDNHVFLQTMLRVLNGKPTPYTEISDQ